MEDGKKIRRMISQGVRYCLLAWAGIFSGTMVAQTQKVVFSRDFLRRKVWASRRKNHIGMKSASTDFGIYNALLFPLRGKVVPG